MPDSPIGRTITAPPPLRGHVITGEHTRDGRRWLATDKPDPWCRGAFVAVEAHRVTLAPLLEWQGITPDFTGSEP